MRGTRIAGLLIRQARLRRDWSQDGLCLGICTPSYLSKIEQGKAEPSPEVTELLLRRLGLVWIPEPEDLKPCWNALLSGSPGFFLCYEQLVLPQQERLACSPLAADILLLAAFYTDTMQPLSEEWEPFLSTRQLVRNSDLQSSESDIDRDLCTAADPCKKIFGEGKFRRDFAADHPDRITFRFGEYYL